MKTKLTLALVAILTGTAFAAMPAVLPEFKNEKQLTEWREEMAAKHATTSTSDVRCSTLDVPSAFYTGKPYIETTGSYAFKYRSYNPELARWTSEDPSGFPDGSNNRIYVNNSVINHFDYSGLWSENVHSTLTIEWAIAIGFSPSEANIIGNACNGVDSGNTAPGIDNSWHFNDNITSTSLSDTRDTHYNDQIEIANSTANRYDQLVALGRALHPLQDEYAHEQISPGDHVWNVIFGINPDDETDRPYRLENCKAASEIVMRNYLE